MGQKTTLAVLMDNLLLLLGGGEWFHSLWRIPCSWLQDTVLLPMGKSRNPRTLFRTCLLLRGSHWAEYIAKLWRTSSFTLWILSLVDWSLICMDNFFRAHFQLVWMCAFRCSRLGSCLCLQKHLQWPKVLENVYTVQHSDNHLTAHAISLDWKIKCMLVLLWELTENVV